MHLSCSVLLEHKILLGSKVDEVTPGVALEGCPGHDGAVPPGRPHHPASAAAAAAAAAAVAAAAAAVETEEHNSHGKDHR